MTDSTGAHKPQNVLNYHQTDGPKDILVELTRSKTKLEEYRIRTEAMINSLGEGLIMTDESGKITTANPYALSHLGFEEDELIGAWFPKAIVAVNNHGQALEQLERPMIRALTTGQPVSDTTRYLKKDGTAFPVFITVAPVLINDQPAGAIEVFRDLTKEQQLEIAKDEFVSLASHQLRTPATGVKLILSMLTKGDFGPLSEVQQRYLQKAIQSNERQLHIIEDLLNVARVDSGKMDLSFEYLCLSDIVQEVVGEHAAIIQSREQTLNASVPDNVQIFGDPQKIRMVIDNLISNASKYSLPEGQIEVSLKSEGDYAILQFKDYGVGMAKSEIPKIFTKFTRLKNELSTSVGGTGLGLFLTKSIVELHRGRIEATSQEGVGSTFIVQLPLRRQR